MNWIDFVDKHFFGLCVVILLITWAIVNIFDKDK